MKSTTSDFLDVAQTKISGDRIHINECQRRREERGSVAEGLRKMT